MPAPCCSRIGTILGKRIRAVASNPMLADITRLQPQTVYIYVIAIASALVACRACWCRSISACSPITA